MNSANNENKFDKSIKQIVDQNKQHISIFTKRDTNNKKNIKIKKNNKNEIDSLSDSENVIENDLSQMILSLQDIIKSIPQNSVKKPDINLQKTHTEWRWRFFNLKERKLIEISKLSPSFTETERLYMDNTGKWIKYNLKGNWNQFLTETRYCYVKD